MSQVTHDFIPRPRGPAWCWCKQQACAGWAAYTAWHDEFGDGPPTDADIELNRLLLDAFNALTARYQGLLGINVSYTTALDLYDIEQAADAHADRRLR